MSDRAASARTLRFRSALSHIVALADAVRCLHLGNLLLHRL